MSRKRVRSVLVGALGVAAVAGLWFFGQRWLVASRYEHDADVADQLIEEGSYAEAIPHLERSLDTARQFGTKDERLDQALQELAGAYGAQGDYVQTQHLYFAAFQNRVEKYGFAHPETADALFKLGRSYELQNLPDVAEGMYNQSILAWEQMNRADDPDATGAYLGLARVLVKLQRHKEAVASHAKALDIQERLLGPENPKLAPLIDAYGGLLEKAGRTEDAQQARERARRLGLETAPADAEPRPRSAATASDDKSSAPAPSATAVAEAAAEGGVTSP